jgi:hypothetical protein
MACTSTRRCAAWRVWRRRTIQAWSRSASIRPLSLPLYLRPRSLADRNPVHARHAARVSGRPAKLGGTCRAPVLLWGRAAAGAVVLWFQPHPSGVPALGLLVRRLERGEVRGRAGDTLPGRAGGDSGFRPGGRHHSLARSFTGHAAAGEPEAGPSPPPCARQDGGYRLCFPLRGGVHTWTVRH